MAYNRMKLSSFIIIEKSLQWTCSLFSTVVSKLPNLAAEIGPKDDWKTILIAIQKCLAL